MSTTDELNAARALRARAQDLARRRDYSAAIKAFESFLEVSGTSGLNLLAYADLLLLARNVDAAREAVARAMQAGSDLSAAHLIAARCARLEGDYDDARDHLRIAIDKRPGFGDAWQLLLDIESPEALAELAPRCAALADDEQLKLRDRVLLSMAAGRAYEKLDNFATAFEEFEKGNSLQRQDQGTRNVRYDSGETEALAARAREAFAEPATLGNSDPGTQPIFIVGMPRSGTTLVERILGGLDGVTVGGESEAVGVIASQYYWLQERGEKIDLSELTADYWRREQASPCRRTDKMPHNFWHVGLIAMLFPNAPVIYMRRDPRDVCMSIFSRVFSDGHPYATSLESIAHFYHVSVELMSFWQQQYQDRIIEVSYEKLVDEPESTTRSIAEHCGLTWMPECLDFHKRVETSFTYSEMQVREPLNRKGIGAWRRYGDQLAPLIDVLRGLGLVSDD